MFDKKLILFFITFLLVTESLSQQLIFKNISNEIAIPVHESYNVTQDSKGYIWISTEAGLCKYNGSYCHVFNKKNGLQENACYAVKEDENGCLWLLTSANGILFFKKDSLKEAQFTSAFKDLQKNNLCQSYSIAFQNKQIIINTQSETFSCDKNSSEITVLEPDTNYGYYFIKKNNTIINVKSEINVNKAKRLAKMGQVTLGINFNGEIKKIELEYKTEDQPNWRVLTSTNNKGESAISLGKILVIIYEDKSYSVIDLHKDIISVYFDKDNGLWVGTVKGGVNYFSNLSDLKNNTSNFRKYAMLNLDGYSVSGICVDFENGVWCTTLEKGVFYCRNKNIINYSNEFGLDKPADLLKIEDNTLFVSTGNNELIQLTENNLIRHKFNLEGIKIISDILRTNNGWLISGSSFVLKTNEAFKNSEFIRQKNSKFYLGTNQFAKTNNGRLFGIHHGEILEFFNNNTKTRKMPLESAGRFIQIIDNFSLLYGTINGLYKLQIDSIEKDSEFSSTKIAGIEGNLSKVYKSSSGEFWIVTKESGIYVYYNGIIKNFSNLLQLSSDRQYDILEDIAGNIWIGSNLGLMRISKKYASVNSLKDRKSNYAIIKNEPGQQQFNPNDFDFNLYTALDGLPTNEIYKLASDKNYIYVSGNEGFFKFDLHKGLLNNHQPNIYLNKLKINGKNCDPNSHAHFSYEDNSVVVLLDALTFKETNNPGICYSLEGLNNQTIKHDSLKGNKLVFNKLPPNTYILSVYALNGNKIASSVPVKIYFTIDNPYWENKWLIFAVIIIIGLFVYFIVNLIIIKINKRAEEKTKINKQLAEFQLTALRAQMNPHFIFNAINSIQNYILKRNEKEAYNYLAKFSKLIRLVLNNSEEKTLSLKEELETIQLYIELEQLRFKNKFTFSLEISQEVDLDSIQIPTMLIQPFIENAIWHGLMNIEDERNAILKLNFFTENNNLVISIEDNGIGREQSIKFKKRSLHKSIAMNLTEKRMLMLNSMYDFVGAKIVVSDVLQENGKVGGTKVEIFLPIN